MTEQQQTRPASTATMTAQTADFDARTTRAEEVGSNLPSPAQAAAYRRYRQAVLDGAIRRPRAARTPA